MANELQFIDPTAGGGKAKISMASRPMDLAGKVVGLLDNSKEQADVILQTVADVLRERYGVADVIVVGGMTGIAISWRSVVTAILMAGGTSFLPVSPG